MKPHIIFIIMVLGILIVPVSAIKVTAEPFGAEFTTTKAVSSLTYDGTSQGLAIQRIGIDAPTGSHVDFTITYGNGDTVTGSAEYTNDGFYQQNSEIVFGGVTSDYHYVGIEEMGRFYVTGYAINDTATPEVPGLVMFGSSYGASLLNSDLVFYPTNPGSDGVMYKVVITSNRPVDITIYTNPRGEVSTAISKSFIDTLNEWVNFALQIGATIYELVYQIFYWLKFFFWDNLLMTIAIYIALTGAIAMNQSKDVFAAIGKFFKYQKTLFEFIIGMWQKLIELIGTFRGIFRI
jgi:hypothetical protein